VQVLSVETRYIPGGTTHVPEPWLEGSPVVSLQSYYTQGRPVN
jgi:hypothetical protein